MQQCRDQLHNLRLGEWVDPFNQAATFFLDKVPCRCCIRPAIWSARSNWPCTRSRTCAGYRHRHSLTRGVLGAGRCYSMVRVRCAADEALRRGERPPDRDRVGFCRGGMVLSVRFRHRPRGRAAAALGRNRLSRTELPTGRQSEVVGHPTGPHLCAEMLARDRWISRLLSAHERGS